MAIIPCEKRNYKCNFAIEINFFVKLLVFLIIALYNGREVRNVYKDVYDKIDEILKERKISRRKLAMMAGININTMSALFARRPERFPDKYLEKIASALSVSIAELKGANLSLFPSAETPSTHRLSLATPAGSPPFDSSKITNAILKSHNFTGEEETPLSFIMAALEKMDKKELDIVADYIGVLKKRKGEE